VQAIGDFLDNAPTPQSLLDKLDALSTAVNPGMTGALTAFSTGITTFGTATTVGAGVW
jgi:hypothetical protein